MKGKRRKRPWQEQPRGRRVPSLDSAGNEEEDKEQDGFRTLLPPVENATRSGRMPGQERARWKSLERPSTVGGRIDTVKRRGYRLAQGGLQQQEQEQVQELEEEKNKEKRGRGNPSTPPPLRRSQMALRDRPKTVAAERRRKKYKRPEKKKKVRIPNYNPWIVDSKKIAKSAKGKSNTVNVVIKPGLPPISPQRVDVKGGFLCGWLFMKMRNLPEGEPHSAQQLRRALSWSKYYVTLDPHAPYLAYFAGENQAEAEGVFGLRGAVSFGGGGGWAWGGGSVCERER